MDCLYVIDPGPFATVQDLGRFGYQRFGVSVSGAMDESSLRVANMLVGNDEGEAAIEFTLAGGSYRIDADICRLAVAGGDFPVSINDIPASSHACHTLVRGDRIAIGAATTGARGYLAVAGGFDLPEDLGSRSTHIRSALGGLNGEALASGAQIPLRAPGTFNGPDLSLPFALWPHGEGPIRVVMGPQDGLFTQAGIETLLSSEYKVSPKSDRMGCRLDGPVVEHAGDFNIVSDGIARGSVQIVGDGQPIVLLADRQTTGGYAKIATIISADLPLFAQRRPGQTVRFEAISIIEAETLRETMLDGLEHLKESMTATGSADRETEHLLNTNLIDGVVGGVY
ncbi:MAG: biotin-dependent carboxyltransferase family protein [Rhodospirillales bacterium]|nr:biotin-dependent carboxyltransferase family protein [Rhodospirillales bacterium]